MINFSHVVQLPAYSGIVIVIPILGIAQHYYS